MLLVSFLQYYVIDHILQKMRVEALEPVFYMCCFVSFGYIVCITELLLGLVCSCSRTVFNTMLLVSVIQYYTSDHILQKMRMKAVEPRTCFFLHVPSCFIFYC